MQHTMPTPSLRTRRAVGVNLAAIAGTASRGGRSARTDHLDPGLAGRSCQLSGDARSEIERAERVSRAVFSIANHAGQLIPIPPYGSRPIPELTAR